MNIKKRIENLSHEEKIQTIKDYEEFEAFGMIGDCTLRTIAEDIGGIFHLTTMAITLEIYRNLFNKK